MFVANREVYFGVNKSSGGESFRVGVIELARDLPMLDPCTSGQGHAAREHIGKWKRKITSVKAQGLYEYVLETTVVRLNTGTNIHLPAWAFFQTLRLT